MKRFISLGLAIVLSFSLFSCLKNEDSIVRSWGSGKPSGVFYLSAEIVSEKRLNIESEFEIKIGIGQILNDEYQTARLEITAPDFTIIAPNGTKSDEYYQIQYDDFDDPKYGLILKDDTELKYFEHFKFIYSGEEKDDQGCISFSIVSEESNEELSGEVIRMGVVIEIYYQISNGEIHITTKRPSNYNPDNQLTEK